MGGYGLYCQPRACEKMYTIPLICKTEISKYDGQPINVRKCVNKQDKVPAQDFGIGLITGGWNLDLDKDRLISGYFNIPRGGSFYWDYREREEDFAAHNKSLEDQLKADEREKDSFRMNLVIWEYRTTGIKYFNIIALSPLFGQKAKTSLNKYFTIDRFEPKQIINYETNKLVWGYKNKNKINRIDQWLSLKPMAPPVVRFRMNAKPQEAPIDNVRFVTILETTDDEFLTDTIQVNLR